MFEISDDDDSFWETVPIDDLTIFNSKLSCPKLESEKGKDEKKSRTDKSLSCTDLQQKLSCESGCSIQNKHLVTHVDSEQNDNNQRVLCDNSRDAVVSMPVMKDIVKHSRIQLESVNSEEQKCSVQKNDTNFRECNTNNSVAVADKVLKRLVAGSPGDGFTPKRTRRKFPGPAGLLPKLRSETTLHEVKHLTSDDEVKMPEEKTVLSSQPSDDVFCDYPWQQLLHDLGSDADYVLKKFSVSGSLQKAMKKQLPYGKVPLLFTVLESLDLRGIDAAVILKDRSGKIQGTFHRDLVKEYESCLQPGVTFVLKQVGVISPTSRSHYLNITQNNIVRIYTYEVTDGVKYFPNITSQTIQELVKMVNNQMQQFTSRRNSPLLKTVANCLPFIQNQTYNWKFNQPPLTKVLRASNPVVLSPGIKTLPYSSPHSTGIETGLSNRSNSLSTLVRKFCFKSTTNTALESPETISCPSKLSVTGINLYKNITMQKTGKKIYPDKGGSNSPIVRTDSENLMSSSSFSELDSENETLIQSTPINRSSQSLSSSATCKYSFKLKSPPTPSISTIKQCNDALNLLSKMNGDRTPSSDTDFSLNKTESNQIKRGNYTTSPLTFSVSDVNGIGMKGCDKKLCTSIDWNNSEWQNSELELTDELLSQLSEEM